MLDKYLAVQFSNDEPEILPFRKITNKITKKLEGWKTNYLSKVGKTMLIQSNIKSIPSHTMQCLVLSNKTTKYLDKFNQDFIWRKKNKYQNREAYVKKEQGMHA